MRLIAILALALAFGCDKEEQKSDCRMAAETHCTDGMKDFDGVVEEHPRWKRCVEMQLAKCGEPAAKPTKTTDGIPTE
jgi:hypothetical protein